eukprot:NODE_12411_length_1226_cov_3.305732.p1 GENE.NODE_12411_length_1226_cov_3.305732~~NODE_12411_length_1226_cov_3.305732.p1  ORF type:complete len:207 (+),score=15.00 NODE_12411_length_1226_cov_3.305732:278-898(+)
MRTLYIKMVHINTSIPGGACKLGFIFLLLHDYNRKVSRMALCSFDGIMMLVSGFVHYLSIEVDNAMVLIAAGQYTVPLCLMQICDLLPHFFILPVILCLDAYRLKSGRGSRMKMLISAVGLLWYMRLYIDYRFFEDEARPRWSTFEISGVISSSTSLRRMFLLATSNLICYLSKMVYRFSRGKKLALFGPSYVHCEYFRRASTVSP